VISQDPVDGTRVDQGTVVTLVVSSGSATVQVPDLRNLPEEAARAKLQEAGLTVSGTKTVDDVPAVEKGTVSATEPKATTVVPKGSAVVLLISSGQVTVPDVQGKLVGDVLKPLNDLRLSVNQVPEVSQQPVGTVLSQDPQPGQKVPVGTAVTLHVAQAAPSTDQPPTAPPSDQSPPNGSPSPTP
jgi:serine/threonine-protein kinase